MATGALEREKYLRYLSQDAYFLFHFNRAYARALYARRLFTGWRWSKPLVTLLLRGDVRVAHK